MKYKLIKIKHTGMRVTIADGPDSSALISFGMTMQLSQPDLQLEVVNGDNVCIWPMSA